MIQYRWCRISSNNNSTPRNDELSWLELQSSLINFGTHLEQLNQFTNLSSSSNASANVAFNKSGSYSMNQGNTKSANGGYHQLQSHSSGGRNFSGNKRGNGRSRSRGGRSSNSSRPTCQICGKIVHLAKVRYYCTNLSYIGSSRNASEPRAYVVSPAAVTDPACIMDSGDTPHVTGDRSTLSNVTDYEEFPALNDILKKHGAEGDEMLGQAQFAGLLQQVLQDLANELAANHVVIIQKIRIINSSRLKELLADENQMKNVAHDIFKDVSDGKVKSSCLERIKLFLEKFLDLPSVEANESVYLFYEQVFTDILDGESDVELEIDGFGAMVKDILKKSAELLDANPIFQNVHH